MHKLAGQKVVLIGGAGFIGHNLALKLKSLGAEVTVVDSLGVNNYYSFVEKRDLIPNAHLYLNIIKQRLTMFEENEIPLYEYDARDYHKLSHVLAELRPDSIVHLAAVSHAVESNKDPYSTFDHNLRTLENALDCARSSELNVRHFVYFSSSMVYGHFPSGAVLEDTPCNPLGIYGALKFAGEKLVIAYNQVFKLPITIVRPSALYGPRCVSRRVGQIFIENAMQDLSISISGDGLARLDFTHVEDLSSGIVKVLENPRSINQIFNLTYGESRSIGEMAQILKEHFPNVHIKYLPKDELTPDRGTLCVDKAREMIGYNPTHPLETGFVDYIRWYQEQWQTLNGRG